MTIEKKIHRGVMDLRAFHQQCIKAGDVGNLTEWRRVLFGAVGVWKKLEQGLGVHCDVIQEQVNRLIASGLTVLWNPNLSDKDLFLTKIKAQPLKPQPTTQHSACPISNTASIIYLLDFGINNIIFPRWERVGKRLGN